MKMNREEFEEIMNGDSGDWDGDNAIQGLLIIIKYLPKSGIEGATHDEIFSCGVDELLDAGLTKEDAEELRRLNWMIDEDSLACFV